MSLASGPWRRRLRLWLPALALVLVAGALLALYAVAFAGRVEAGVARFDRASIELQRLEARRVELEERLAAARQARDRLHSFYRERLGVEAERLTAILSEVKDLAATAGLEPSSIRYSLEPLEEYGLLERSIDFTVQGSYLELRRLINLLELTETFVTLEEISLSESGDQEADLRITLGLTTLLASSPEMPERSAGGRGART